MYPGELPSLLMDSWRATGSSTSPLPLCKVCLRMLYTQSWANMLRRMLTFLSNCVCEQEWVKWWQWMWGAAGSDGWRLETWSKEWHTRSAFKPSQSAMGRQYKQTSLLSLCKVQTAGTVWMCVDARQSDICLYCLWWEELNTRITRKSPKMFVCFRYYTKQSAGSIRQASSRPGVRLQKQSKSKHVVSNWYWIRQ